MYIKHSYPQEFTDLMMHLRAKYPEELLALDGISDDRMDIHESSKRFFDTTLQAVADASIDANANVADKSVINYNFEIGKALMKFNSYYNIWKYLKKEHDLATANQIIEMQLSGDIYINDVWDVGRPYCFNYSTYDIALEGLKMGDRIKPARPKSLYSFVRQVEQFTVYAANSTLGATGLADLLIMIAWYVDRIGDNDEYCPAEPHYKFLDQQEAFDYVREVLASLIYTLNWQFRGNQSPFTNVSVYDDEFLKEMIPEYVIEGVAPEMETVKRVQELFLDVMNEELRRAPITFPVVTACFATADDKIADEKFAEMVAEKNLEFGFINMYCGKSSTLSSCCRLRSERDNEYFNSFGAGSSKIGSLGVVTMNLPRMAMRHCENTADDMEPEDNFLDGVRTLVRVCADVNNAKRQFLKKRVADGVLPLYDLGFMDLKRQYSTCGVTGLYEACEILGYDMKSNRGQDFVMRLLKNINRVNDFMSKIYQAPHNCEQVPAENSSIKLAEKDKLMGYDAGVAYYSNQFIPLIVEADMLDRIKLQGKFDSEFSGGAICHLNVAEKIDDPKKIVKLIKQCARMGVVYWAINYKINRCAYGHMSVGDTDKCGICGNPIEETFTRVVGFLTNTKNWHEVRRHHDWPQRQFYGKV